MISDGIIQYDLGRRFPHAFVRKDHVHDNLPRPSSTVRAFLAKLQARETSRLQERALDHLSDLQQKQDNTVTYPRPVEDRLFKPTYRHKHYATLTCPTCSNGTDSVCDAALKLSCQALGCDEQESVLRTRSRTSPGKPAIHFGLFASGDSVMKSGEDRDRIASPDGVIAFEMEGAGAWEAFPGCLIIKGSATMPIVTRAKVGKPMLLRLLRLLRRLSWRIGTPVSFPRLSFCKLPHIHICTAKTWRDTLSTAIDTTTIKQ